MQKDHAASLLTYGHTLDHVESFIITPKGEMLPTIVQAWRTPGGAVLLWPMRHPCGWERLNRNLCQEG